MLTDRELATVLAALRHWLQAVEENGEEWASTWPHFVDLEPLSPAQVDSLCESLNCDDPAPSATPFIEMCRRVADSATNWSDCSDYREAIAVFKELGGDCQRLLASVPGTAASPRYVLYDIDTDELATKRIYGSYSEAKEDAEQLQDVLVVQWPIAARS